MAQADLLDLFVRPLSRGSIPYVITGAVAAIVYGVPRLTEDIDLIVELKRSEIPALTRLYPADRFYLPPEEVLVNEVSRQARGEFNIIHLSTGLKADIYLCGRDPLHAWAFQNRRSISVKGEEYFVAPPEYVILRKLQFYQEGKSEKHIDDIRAIVDISGGNIDLDWLEKSIKENGLEEAWRLVNKEDKEASKDCGV